MKRQVPAPIRAKKTRIITCAEVKDYFFYSLGICLLPPMSPNTHPFLRYSLLIQMFSVQLDLSGQSSRNDNKKKIIDGPKKFVLKNLDFTCKFVM
jgi:hypothetical protein